MKDNFKRGSVSIEAAISLVAMISVMCFLNSFIKVTLVHGIVQHALTQTANEMATYNYILSLLGFNELNDTLKGSDDEAEGFTNAINEKVNDFTDLYEDLCEVTDENGSALTNQSGDVIDFSGGIANVTDIVSRTTDATEDVYAGISRAQELLDFSTIKGYLIDGDGNLKIKDLFVSFFMAGVNTVYEGVKEKIFNSISLGLLSTYIPRFDDSDILEKNLVVGGLDGLDFTGSVYFDEPNLDNITLNCTYCVKIVSPIPIIEYVPMCNNVTVRTWQDEWTTVALKGKEVSGSCWVENADINLTWKILNKTGDGGDERTFTNKPIHKYTSSNKTAMKFMSLNFITGEYADNGESSLNQKLSDIRNIDFPVKLGDNEIKDSDVKIFKLYIYVPAESAVMGTEAGHNLTAAQNALIKAENEKKPDVSVEKKAVSEAKKEVTKLEKELANKKAKLNELVKEKEKSFNAEGNPFRLDIIIKSVDYPPF